MSFIMQTIITVKAQYYVISIVVDVFVPKFHFCHSPVNDQCSPSYGN